MPRVEGWPHPPGWKPGDPVPDWFKIEPEYKEREYDGLGDTPGTDKWEGPAAPGTDRQGDGTGEAKSPKEALEEAAREGGNAEKPGYEVIVTKAAPEFSKKIQAIGAIMDNRGMSLKEAKGLAGECMAASAIGMETHAGTIPTAYKAGKFKRDLEAAGWEVRTSKVKPEPKPERKPEDLDPLEVADELRMASAMLMNAQAHVAKLVEQGDVSRLKRLIMGTVSDLTEEYLQREAWNLSELADVLDNLQRLDGKEIPPEQPPDLPDKEWEALVVTSKGDSLNYLGRKDTAIIGPCPYRPVKVEARLPGQPWRLVPLGRWAWSAAAGIRIEYPRQ